MATPRRKQNPYVIARQDQLNAVRSPVRQEILHHMATLGPCSVAELAAKMDRPPDALYYHVKALVKVGLMNQQGTRRGVRRSEAVYALPSRRIRFELDPASQTSRGALVGAVGASLRLTERDFQRALESGKVVTSGKHQDIRSRRYRAWLDKDGLAKVNRLLSELDELMLEQDNLRRGRPHALTYILTPVRMGRQ